MTQKRQVECCMWGEDLISVDIRYSGLCFEVKYLRENIKSETMLAAYEKTLGILMGDIADDSEIISHLLTPFESLMAQLASDHECRPRAAKLVLSDYLYPTRILLEAWAKPQSTSIEPVLRGPLVLRPPGQILETTEISRLRLMQRFTSNDIELDCPNGLNPTKVIAGGVLCYFKHKQHNFKRMEMGKPWVYEQITAALKEQKLHSNVCRPHGIVIDDNYNEEFPGQRMIGVLIVYIDNKGTLYNVAPKCHDKKRLLRWADEIRAIVDDMHKAGLVWGDAKPHNVLVGHEDELWVIDVDGSYTEGWVDENQKETKEGDSQALDKILAWLAKLSNDIVAS